MSLQQILTKHRIEAFFGGFLITSVECEGFQTAFLWEETGLDNYRIIRCEPTQTLESLEELNA